ncbi:MAG: DegT/DnrJ/EryC1/StrS family aminotransferase [Bacteroidetes bacterium]|nr:DegT/DnrJ/EryC1/StrS family aminotransferase [Bacteroidota bacterium]
MMIPVFEPYYDKREIDLVVEALQAGEISGTFGRFIEEFESKFAAYSGCKYGVAVTSGTTALHMAVAALNIQRGDEILVSASTNIATALGVYHNQGITVPVDSEAETWNLDISLIEKLITPKTKAIIPVHLFGHPVQMNELMKIAAKHKIAVIEDAAEAHGALCDGQKVGSFGDMACFSFYANKIITTGEGGMITTNNAQLAEKLRLLRNLGFAKPRFLHQVPAYNFRMTGMQAAFGVGQMEKIEEVIDKKRTLAQWYNEELGGIKALQLPAEKSWAKNVYWMYGIKLKKEFGFNRDKLMLDLTAAGVDTRTFFCPMSQQPFLYEQKDFRGTTPVADDLWENGLYLPSSTTLTHKEVQFIGEVLKRLLS